MSYCTSIVSKSHDLRVQARLEQQLKNKLLTLLAQKGSMTQEVSPNDLFLFGLRCSVEGFCGVGGLKGNLPVFVLEASAILQLIRKFSIMLLRLQFNLLNWSSLLTFRRATINLLYKNVK